MFSGIVEESAAVHLLTDTAIVVESALDHSETHLGDSISINGCCLTVVEYSKRENKKFHLRFEIAPESFRRTTLGSLKTGSKVNLERSLQIGSRLHGHFVFGHVDTVVTLISRQPDGNSHRLELSLPAEYKKFVVPKGSVSLSGVSLTVGEVTADSFSVYIVPHTSEVTVLSALQPGDGVNFEIDMLARYVHSTVLNSPEQASR